MVNNVSSKKWLEIIGKEKLQTFQDAFSRVHGISLCFIDLEGHALTVWSNSSLFCFSMLKRQQKRCQLEKQKAVEEARKEGKFMSIDDMKIRSKVGNSVADLLKQFGCLDGMSQSNQISLFG